MTLENPPGGQIAVGDLTVGRLGFGAMRLGGPDWFGPPPDPVGAAAVLRAVVDAGIQFIDTADAYGPDTNEELIAEALHPYPDGVVVTTKGGLCRRPDGSWYANGHPAYLAAACRASCRRLRVDVIEHYQFHRPDPAIPIEESIGALEQLRREGLIRQLGVSNVDIALLRRCQAEARIDSVQNRFNIADRASDEVVAACERDSVAFMPWGPLLGTDRVPGFGAIAASVGVTPHQLTLAWLLARSPAILPIPGTSSIDHLHANVAAASLELGADVLARLDDVDVSGEPFDLGTIASANG